MLLAVGFLPFLMFGLLALAPVLDTSDDAEDPPETGDPVTEEPVAEQPADSATTVQIIAAGASVTEVVIDASDPDAPTSVDGTDEAETIVAPTEVASSFGINGLAGADTINFGYGVNVDGGDGADDLTLTVTDQALSNGDLVTGVVNFADTTDALAIDIEEEAVGFVHEVRIETSETEDDTTTSSATLYYVLSPDEVLVIDEDATAASGAPVLGDGTSVLTQIDLGTRTTVTGTDSEGAPTTTVTGDFNADPAIMLNRDVSSTTAITI